MQWLLIQLMQPGAMSNETQDEMHYVQANRNLFKFMASFRKAVVQISCNVYDVFF